VATYTGKEEHFNYRKGMKGRKRTRGNHIVVLVYVSVVFLSNLKLKGNM